MKNQNKFLFLALAFSLFMHLLTAWFSAGYLQFDEHFQILEFINYKLGLTATQGLPWEFHTKMRSWVLPYFYLAITRMEQGMGIANPLIWATSFRFATALIGWFAIACTCIHVPAFLGTRQPPASPWNKLAVLLLCSLWYLPFIHARTTGENLSGSLFMIAMCWMLVTPSALKIFLSGLLLGLGFQLRFQVGFMIFGLGMYWFVVHRPRFTQILGCAFGFALATALALLADKAGYGVWVSTAWNYLNENIFAGKVAGFGHRPWWFFFKEIAISLPPLSLLLLVFSFIALLLRPKHLLTWITVPFVFIHCVIQWKELRFLFPLSIMFPLLGVVGISACWPDLLDKPVKNKCVRVVLGLLILMNLAGLFVFALRPASSTYSFYSYVLENHSQRFEYYSLAGDPYTDVALRYRYYEPKQLMLHAYPGYDFMKKDLLMRGKEPFFLFHDRLFLPSDAQELNPACVLVYEAHPHWMRKLNVHHLLEQSRWWSLYRCDPSLLTTSGASHAE